MRVSEGNAQLMARAVALQMALVNSGGAEFMEGESSAAALPLIWTRPLPNMLSGAPSPLSMAHARPSLIMVNLILGMMHRVTSECRRWIARCAWNLPWVDWHRVGRGIFPRRCVSDAGAAAG